MLRTARPKIHNPELAAVIHHAPETLELQSSRRRCGARRQLAARPLANSSTLGPSDPILAEDHLLRRGYVRSLRASDVSDGRRRARRGTTLAPLGNTLLPRTYP